eukprot:jgi/Botrbrau1/6585/Bobra.0189s0012.1
MSDYVIGCSREGHRNVVDLPSCQEDGSKRFCFLAGPSLVVQDGKDGQQTHKQHHSNAISCILLTRDGQSLISADKGPNSQICVWDAKSLQMLRSIKCPYADSGLIAFDLTPDSNFLLSLAADSDSSETQDVALWDLSCPYPSSRNRTIVPAGDPQYCICVNAEHPTECATTGRRRVYFWEMPSEAQRPFQFYSPALKAADFYQSVGDFTVTAFVPGGNQAVTGTSGGDVVVWGHGLEAVQEGFRQALKVIKLHSSAITAMLATSSRLVTGGADGNVRFFDSRLRLTAWFEDMKAGGICSISCAACDGLRRTYTMRSPGLNEPHFIVSTTENRIVRIQTSTFENERDADRRGETLLEGPRGHVIFVYQLPSAGQSEVVFITHDGIIQVWNLSNKMKSREAKVELGGSHACSAACSGDGSLLAIGGSRGQTLLLSSDTLQTSEQIFSLNLKQAIVHVALSQQARHLATISGDGVLSLHSLLEGKKGQYWLHVGDSKLSSDVPMGLSFAQDVNGSTKLLSLGMDRSLTICDASRSSTSKGLHTKVLRQLWDEDTSIVAFSVIPSSAPSRDQTPVQATAGKDVNILSSNVVDKLGLMCGEHLSPRAKHQHNPAGPCSAPDLEATDVGVRASGGDLVLLDDAGTLRRFEMFTWQCTAVRKGYSGVNQLHHLRHEATGKSWLAYTAEDKTLGVLPWPSVVEGMDVARRDVQSNLPIDKSAACGSGSHLLTCNTSEGVCAIWKTDALINAYRMAGIAVESPGNMESMQFPEDIMGEVQAVFLKHAKPGSCAGARSGLQGHEDPREPALSACLPKEALQDFFDEVGERLDLSLRDILALVRDGSRLVGRSGGSGLYLRQAVWLLHHHRRERGPSLRQIEDAFQDLGADPDTGRLTKEQLLEVLQPGDGTTDAYGTPLQCLRKLCGGKDPLEVLPEEVSASFFAEQLLGIEPDLESKHVRMATGVFKCKT